MAESTENDYQTVYISWKAPSRLFKKRDKEFFRNIAAIVFFILVILVFAREFPLILAVVSVSFLIYVFSTIPPEEVTHTISNFGIESAGKFYQWNKLKEFWFEEQWGQRMVVITEEAGSKLILLLSDTSEEKIKEIFSRFIHFQKEPQKTFVDNAASWLSKKVPLENPS